MICQPAVALGWHVGTGVPGSIASLRTVVLLASLKAFLRQHIDVLPVLLYHPFDVLVIKRFVFRITAVLAPELGSQQAQLATTLTLHCVDFSRGGVREFRISALCTWTIDLLQKRPSGTASPASAPDAILELNAADLTHLDANPASGETVVQQWRLWVHRSKAHVAMFLWMLRQS